MSDKDTKTTDIARDQEDQPDKEIVIIVNGREKTVEDEELTFDQVVALAFDDPPTGAYNLFHNHLQACRRPQAGRHTDRGQIGEGETRNDI